MGHEHLPWKRLRAALEAGTLSRESIASILDHLREVCPECRRQAETPDATDAQTYREVFERSIASLGELSSGLERSLAMAERDFKALLKLSHERQLSTIGRSYSHYRSPFLVDLLLSECTRLVACDPTRALELAECAHAASLRIPHASFGGKWAITCTARATAHRGNALRAIGEITQGSRLIRTSREMLEQHGFDDPYVEAELYGLVASVSKDQGAFDEALRHTDHVIATYSLIKEEHLVGRALVMKSTIYYYMSDITQALATTEDALARLDSTQDEALFLMAEHNRILYTVELGRFAEARELVTDSDLSFTGTTAVLRHQWLLGKIAHGLGQLHSAENTFADVRKRFITAELPFDAALAGLDLALVFIDLGKTSKLRKIAEAMLPIFHAQDVERETIASLMLFQEAARQEVVTRSMVEELVSYMLRASRRPQRREVPS